ncbi:M16 family metallopeptidase [Novispirillum itersonii]|uniref:M16 family metallopeptidase n=1 Tax=Novispirillum itersonii TaxID=189 RepID=UPI0003647AE9|nr:pitrilysin family protein [Novispirillum itersonii]
MTVRLPDTSRDTLRLRDRLPRRLSGASAIVLGLLALSSPALALPGTAVPAAPMASPVAVADSHPLFDAKTFTLENGLTVVVVENHRVPVVNQMVWYKVGAADEPPGKSGLAHLLEHLMFKGTAEIPPGEFSRIIARNGGQDNAFTSSDYTAYYQTIAVDQLPLLMKMEADRMRNLRLDDATVLTERDVVVEERLSRVENEPSALLGERVDAALWGVHPYRNPVIGWANELKALTRDDALEFYRRWYAPNNATLVVTGDVTVEQVRSLAEQYFGPVPRGPDIARTRPQDTGPQVQTALQMHHPRVAQPEWNWTHRAPGVNTAVDRQQVLALQVLSEILGGGPVSRLYRSLVVKDKLAVTAGSRYSALAVDDGTFSIYATPRPGISAEAVRDAVKAEVARLLMNGVTEQEVLEARQRMRAGVLYARDTLQGASQAIGAALTVGSTLEDIEYWPQQINTVTREQVMEAARLVLREEGGVSALLLPETPPAPPAAPAKPAKGKPKTTAKP